LVLLSQAHNIFPGFNSGVLPPNRKEWPFFLVQGID